VPLQHASSYRVHHNSTGKRSETANLHEVQEKLLPGFSVHVYWNYSDQVQQNPSLIHRLFILQVWSNGTRSSSAHKL